MKGKLKVVKFQTKTLRGRKVPLFASTRVKFLEPDLQTTARSPERPRLEAGTGLRHQEGSGKRVAVAN